MRGEMSEADIDDTLTGSFPASDPPSWTLGTDRPPGIDECNLFRRKPESRWTRVKPAQ